MKVLVILLCVAIGHVFGELEGREAGEGNSRVNNNVLKDVGSPVFVDYDEIPAPERNSRVNKNVMKDVGSPVFIDYDEMPAPEVENLRGNYDKGYSFDQTTASAEYADSVGKETSRNPTTPVTETTTVKPTSFKAMENNLEIMYLRKPEAQVFEIIDNPNDTSSETGKQTVGDLLKSVYWTTDEQSRKVMILANTEGSFLRMKREAELGDPGDAILSYRAYNDIRKKLPLSMRLKIRETVLDEDMLLDSYAKFGKATKDLLEAYNAAKFVELEELKKQTRASGTGVQELIAKYKALRKGKPWNFVKLREKYRAFFDQPSPALVEYDTLKLKELTLIDGFLSGSDQAEGESGATEPTMPETGETAVPPPEMAGANKAGLNTGVPRVQANEDENDPADILASFEKYLKLSANFSADLKLQMFHTDAAEKRLLLSYMESNAAPKEILYNYYAERKKEIELLRQELAGAGTNAPAILSAYKARRKGTIWNYLKNTDDERRNYFNQVSTGRSEYEALKRKELDIDSYLNGSLVIEGQQGPDNSERTQAIQQYTVAKTEEAAYKMERPMVAEIAGAKEDKEMERRVRDTETEVVIIKNVVYRESVENFVSKNDYAKGDVVDLDEFPADVTKTEATTNTAQAKSRSRLVRIAVLFALVMQVIIAILILGPEVNKLPEWWKRRKASGLLATGEKASPALLPFPEPLYAGKKSLLLARPCAGKSRRLLCSQELSDITVVKN